MIKTFSKDGLIIVWQNFCGAKKTSVQPGIRTVRTKIGPGWASDRTILRKRDPNLRNFYLSIRHETSWPSWGWTACPSSSLSLHPRIPPSCLVSIPECKFSIERMIHRINHFQTLQNDKKWAKSHHKD